MLKYKDVNEKYYAKFNKYIGLPINDFPSDEYEQNFYKECLDCIEENREFDSEIFNEKYGYGLPNDAII